ncbi:MAG: A/G-specific adenine glycosylase [Saprospiraceae bacterium]|nr:A/G-specific adenine glycosylase [Bacteroidia bacterium]NNE13396.1 A/G-specific adenine glycosylase [Saprospiraceae bacterium]NNL92996.1 A/G-specific adenine glycosylase [Saprospiraceae bacterium]
MATNFKRLSTNLIKWYLLNKRDLPWRKTKDPYKVWLSEIMLQQTTVAQGLGYYLRFLRKFKTLKSLAKANIDAVLKMWEGLGYYSRARNLHFTAQYIQKEFGGKFPNTYDDLLKLKGVGPYTAAAISSFCFNENHVVVDGNVTRVISRLFGIEEDVLNLETKKKIKAFAQNLCDTQSPDVFNQAIMEVGAMVCKTHKPLCSSCPFSKKCLAKKSNLIPKIPFKSKKIKRRPRFFNFSFFIIENESTLIQKRMAKDIWQGLYQFPLVEVDNLEKINSIQSPFNGVVVQSKNTSKVFKQLLTHQTIYSVFHTYYISAKTYEDLKVRNDLDGYLKINIENVVNYAWPRTIDLYLNDLSIPLF